MTVLSPRWDRVVSDGHLYASALGYAASTAMLQWQLVVLLTLFCCTRGSSRIPYPDVLGEPFEQF